MDKAIQRRRLAILVILSVRKHYKAPVADIRDELGTMGYAESLVVVRSDGDFLDETGLVRFDRENDTLAETERGLDVATGRAFATGVGTPGPRG